MVADETIEFAALKGVSRTRKDCLYRKFTRLLPDSFAGNSTPAVADPVGADVSQSYVWHLV
jgi:hypothetical protein